MTIEPGQQLLHYRIVEKIGEGGMGVVWKAEDTCLHRHVALKLVSSESEEDAREAGQFIVIWKHGIKFMTTDGEIVSDHPAPSKIKTVSSPIYRDLNGDGTPELIPRQRASRHESRFFPAALTPAYAPSS